MTEIGSEPRSQEEELRGSLRDVSDQGREQERTNLLARAGDAIGGSLDYGSTLAELARLAVPAVADWCMVYVQEPEGRIRRLAVEHFGGRHEGVLERLEEHEFRLDAELGVPAVVRTGVAELHRDADSLLVASDVVEGEQLAEELGELGICSWMCVPLTARGRTFGALSFLSTESGRKFDEADLELAEELARRAALAVDNARLYEESQRSLALLDAILASAPTAIGIWDRDIRYVRVNDALAQLNGIPAEEHVGKSLWDVIPDMAPVLEPVYRGVVETGEPLIRYEASTDLAAHRLGNARHWLSSYFPVKTEDGEIIGVGAVIMEITERKVAEEMAATRARQQAGVAELGLRALSGADVEDLTREAAERVAETLRVDFVEVLELLDDGRLLLAEGVGWHEGHVGTTVVPAGRGSQGGFTLEAAEPVLAEDLAAETRFTASPLLREHEVTSGLTVVVPGLERGFGVIGAHTREPRSFTQDDANYLQAVANVLGAALDQRRLAVAEHRARARLAFLADASRLLAASLDYDSTVKAVADLAGTDIADWMTVYLVEDGGKVRRVIGRHPDPERDALVREAVERYPRPIDETHPVHSVIRDGASKLIAELPEDSLREFASDEEHLALLRRLGVRSVILAPIAVAGSTIGAIGFVRSREPAYTDEDVGLAEELARRAGLAIENARLYESARYQAQLNRAISDNAASALFLADARGRGTYMNVAGELMTGFTAEEIQGASLHELMHHTRPDGSPFPAEECPILHAVVEGRELRDHEDAFVRKDGSLFPVVLSVTPLFEQGRVSGIVLEARDVTRERELFAREQEARREAEARAQSAQALEFVGDGVFLVDRGGVVRLWNPAAEAITGLPAADVVGRPVEEAVPGWAGLAASVPVAEAESGSSARPQTLPLDVGDREVWLSIAGVAFEHGTVFAFRDVTEERGVEKLKSDFVSTISHELRTPLAAIYGAALTLRRSDMPLEGPHRGDLLAVIASESERLARIVNDILWTSRIESGGLQVTIEACDGVELARAVVRSAQLQLPPNLELRLDASAGLPLVAADPDKVRQVLANLVENSVKYSPDGGTITVRLEQFGDRVRFLVSDQGLGIPMHEQERIFEKFYRLDPNLTRGVGGTGLGLYICRQLVLRMGGAIRVESQEGRGSTFTVELPAAAEVAAHGLL
jgi:PAS domain S-box-containing protein